MRFEFATAGRILFGPGAVKEVAPAARALGSRALLVTGRTPERASPLSGELGCAVFSVPTEPTVDDVRQGTSLARAKRADIIVACGGGSAIDAGKAIAALLANGGDPLDYLEVIGRGRPLTKPSAPFIAVPTTAGTGSEVTRNAVLGSPKHGVKASLRSPHLLARLAVVDPDLTLDLPPAITASTGLDALTQLIEPYVSPRASALTDLFCEEGMRRVARSLVRAYRDGADRGAREDMAYASLLGGLALANAGLGAVHGFAAVVGGKFPSPHGAACAALLPHVMEVNLRALRLRAPDSDALRRYDTVARILTGSPQADDAVTWVRRTVKDLRIPSLEAYYVSPADIPGLAEKAAQASSMKANPIVLTAEELRETLERAIGLR